MFIKQMQVKSLLVSVVFWVVLLNSAQSSAAGTEWNNSSDPNGLYGLCHTVGNGSGIGQKNGYLHNIGETLVDVIAITVLECKPYTTANGTFKTPCPANIPYAYCLGADNDGRGNYIRFGVLKLNEKTDPNGLYTNCPMGSQLRSKFRIIYLANRDPRFVKGIVTLSCVAATAPTQTKASVVNCPARPNPYTYCLRTPNDGFGNAVIIGVVAAQEQGDPYALYGECTSKFSLWGVTGGFKSKSSLVTSTGRSLANVRSIDIIGCDAAYFAGPNWPRNLIAGSCSSAIIGIPFPGRYDYCIWGTDTKGNTVIAGVNKR